MSLTVITTLKLVVPPEFKAVTVYAVIAVTFKGVPDIIPVCSSKDRPAGSSGEIAYETTFPLTDGVKEDMVCPTVKMLGEL